METLVGGKKTPYLVVKNQVRVKGQEKLYYLYKTKLKTLLGKKTSTACDKKSGKGQRSWRALLFVFNKTRTK